MKKIIALLLAVLAVGLTGCGSTSAPSTSAEPTETQEKAEQVIYEDDMIKVSYIEIFEEAAVQGACYLKCNVENKTDGQITVYTMDSYVNDSSVQMGSGVPMTIAAGKKSQNPFYVPYTNAGVESMGDIKNLELKFMLMDENSSTLETTDNVTIQVGE